MPFKTALLLLVILATSAPSWGSGFFLPPKAPNSVYVDGSVRIVYHAPGLHAMEVGVTGDAGNIVRLDCGEIDCSAVEAGDHIQAHGLLQGYLSCRHDTVDVGVILTELVIVVE